MKKSYSSIRFSALFIVALAAILSLNAVGEWGFFGHRRINRLAVFTLPPDMTILFKEHIEYVTAHAVDPDKRRYSTKGEDIKHYIDIDHWGKAPFDNIPRDWTNTLIKFTSLHLVNHEGDTVVWQQDFSSKYDYRAPQYILYNSDKTDSLLVEREHYRQFFFNNIFPQQREENWLLHPDSIQQVLGQQDCKAAFAIDHFSPYGIQPYNLLRMKKRLTNAFEAKDGRKILQLSSELGHYIADAHVPLHTTENYNGQLTDQVGIHGFWESRLPELFADENYDYFVGKATYIDQPRDYFWDVLLESHALLDSVLLIEKRLSHTYPSDQQFCFEERLDIVVKTQCRHYAGAYHDAMQGMVEKRFRDAALSIGSIWYTCWVDAGQPDLKEVNWRELSEKEKKERKKLEADFKAGKIKGRQHQH